MYTYVFSASVDPYMRILVSSIAIFYRTSSNRLVFFTVRLRFSRALEMQQTFFESGSKSGNTQQRQHVTAPVMHPEAVMVARALYGCGEAA